uniref:Putative secreted protein n=1 Tax=Anopheles darlingi TaxID=43151 RepID=A0A2M4DHP2_ANODA
MVCFIGGVLHIINAVFACGNVVMGDGAISLVDGAVINLCSTEVPFARRSILRIHLRNCGDFNKKESVFP